MKVTGKFEFRLPFKIAPPVETKDPFPEIAMSALVETVLDYEPCQEWQTTSYGIHDTTGTPNQELSHIVSLKINLNFGDVVIRIPFPKDTAKVTPTDLVIVEVTGELSKATIKNPGNWRHAQEIQEFYGTALAYLKLFLESFRYRTRNYYSEPFHYRLVTAETEVGSQHGWSHKDAFEVWVELEHRVNFSGSTWFDNKGNAIETLAKLPMLRPLLRHDINWHRNYTEEDLFLIERDLQASACQEPEEDSVRTLCEEMILYAMNSCHKRWSFFKGMDEDSQILLQGTVVNVALMNIAIACEVYVKHFVEKRGRVLHKLILEKYREFQIPVIEYLDVILKDIQGSSLKAENRILFGNIKLLFEVRNKIAHQGRAFIVDRGKQYAINELADIIGFASDAYALLDWLDKVEAGAFLSQKSALLWSEYLKPAKKSRRQEIIGRAVSA